MGEALTCNSLPCQFSCCCVTKHTLLAWVLTRLVVEVLVLQTSRRQHLSCNGVRSWVSCAQGHARCGRGLYVVLGHAGGKRGKKGAVQDIGRKDESDISKLVRMIMARQFDPVRPCVRVSLASILYISGSLIIMHVASAASLKEPYVNVCLVEDEAEKKSHL